MEIPKKYLHQSGRFRGKLNQTLLFVDTDKKLSKGDHHPEVKGVVFQGYRESGKQRWQLAETYKLNLNRQKERREKLKQNAPPKDPSTYTGLNKGSIPQKLLQTGINTLKPGDAHPTHDKYILIRIRSSRNNPEQWGLPESRTNKLTKRAKDYDKEARAKGVKKKDHRQTDQTTEFEIWDEHPFIENLFFVGYYTSKAESTKGKRMERWATEEKLKKRIEDHDLWAKNNKDKKAESDKNYRLNNKEKIQVNKSNYYQRVKGTSAYKENRNAYEKNRLENDEHFRIRKLYSGRLRTACRSQGTRKALKTEELLGCSIKKFKKHIESLFSNGMTWKNFKWDGWHIDHIIPCAFFDLTKPSHQKVCFNWQNLQPLWAEDNLSKRDKFPLSILLVILKYEYDEITV